MTQTIPDIDFGPWNVEHLRLTVFAPGFQATELWEKVMGVPPESIEQRPREASIRQQGEADGNRLHLATNADRLDWTFVPNPTVVPGANITPPLLRDPDQAVRKLQEALNISLPSVRQVHRMAFGMLLGQEVASQAEGMSRFSQYLPHMNLEEQDASDFMFQVNRRRQLSTVPYAQVNRIARWSLEQMFIGEVRIGISPAQAPQLMPPSEPVFINRLSLDINTAPENNAIAVVRMPSLFAELITLACRVAAEGDVL